MSFEKDIWRLEAEKKTKEEDKNRMEQELKACEAERAAAEEARKILQLAARKTQEKIEIHFSALVSNALKAVFNDPYTFVPVFEERRNTTECDLWYERSGEYAPTDFAVGGSVNDISSFACRLAYNRLEQGAPVLILDEPFKNLDKDKLPRTVELLHLLAREFEIQFIINTHIPEIAERADKVFEIHNGAVIRSFPKENKNGDDDRLAAHSKTQRTDKKRKRHRSKNRTSG